MATSESTSATQRAWMAVSVSIVLWATAFPAIRVAVTDYHPATLAAFRLLVASIALAVVAPLLSVSRPRIRDLPMLVLCGVLGMAGYQLLLNWGEETVNAGTASLLVSTSHAYSVLLAAAILGEKLSARRIGGICIALVGAALIALGEGDVLDIEPGVALVLGAAFAYGTYHVAHRPLLSRYSGATVTCYATWFATLLTAPLLASLPKDWDSADLDATVAAVFLGLGPSAVAFATWAYGVHRLGVGAAATSLYLVPAVALPIAAVWLGELPTPIELVGGAIAFVGVAIANRRTTQQPEATSRSARQLNAETRMQATGHTTSAS
jgi:drug/metabolite transporter (DMT)-like permease